MPPTLQDQCTCTDPFGMHLLGQQKVENTKQIINTNPLLEATQTSNYKVVPLKALSHVNHPLSLLGMVALALNNIGQCNGSKTITWSTIIVTILEETTILFPNAKAIEFKFRSSQDESAFIKLEYQKLFDV